MTEKYNLFIDLDDVLISSHNEMNSDLIKKYPENDWARVDEYENNIQRNLKYLKNINNKRSLMALDAILKLRDKIKFENVRYDYMQQLFDDLQNPNLDKDYCVEENHVYHIIIKLLGRDFIAKERFLDERDTVLYEDNKVHDGTQAVHYEKYYTKEMLLGSEKYRNNPEYVRTLQQSPLFNKPLMVLSHLNGDNERNAKDKFLKECYPETFFSPLFFHEQNYLDKEVRRTRYSKAKFVSNVLKLDIKKSILIDDSIDNIINWSKNGGIAILYDLKGDKVDTDDYFVIHSLREEEINNVISMINSKNNTKKLIKE